MNWRSRRVVVPIIVLVAIGALYLSTRGGGIPVETATLARDTLSVGIAVEGRTRATDLFTVAAPVTGRLTRITLEEGAEIEIGAVVARILPSQEDPRMALTLRAELEAARAAHIEARAGVEQAHARADQARREADRRTSLTELGALSSEAIEQAEVAARVAERMLEAADATASATRARVDAAQARLLGASGDGVGVPAVEVRSPVSGRVLRVVDASERVVAAGTPIVELADVRGLEVVLDVLSEDAVRIEPGQDIHITEWGGDTVLTGRVRAVTLSGYTKVSALGVEEQRVDVIGDLHAPPASLGSGYRVAGDIVVWRGDAVLTVPSNSVFRSENGWAVYLVDQGRAVRREVVLGRRNQDRAEVLEGLAEGEQVILFPPSSIEEGARVLAGSGAP